MIDLLPRRTDVIVCILNGSADSNRAHSTLERLVGLFAQNDAKVQIVLAQTGREAPALARRAVEDGAALVIAAGGDGTVNCVASALINTKVALGVLPLGTLNHFAKDLKIPLKLDAAVANLFSGTIARVDVGEVNGQFFLNNSSLGLYPTFVHQRTEGQNKGHVKWLAFAEATLFALRHYSRLYVSLQSKDQSAVDAETSFVFVGNNRYQMSGLHIGERERLDAGRLWVYRAPRASRAVLFALAIHALTGRQDPGELQIFDAEEFWIRAKKGRLHVATDGEVVNLNTPLHYRIHPRALSVIVPTAVHAHSSN
jgi:diacylglycerol kinase family enzyme